MKGTKGSEGAKGSEAYCILGFWVPTTFVGARGEGAKGSEWEQSVLYTRFQGPHHLCGNKG